MEKKIAATGRHLIVFARFVTSQTEDDALDDVIDARFKLPWCGGRSLMRLASKSPAVSSD